MTGSRFIVPDGLQERLDRTVQRQVSLHQHFSRSQAERLIEAGVVRVNDKVICKPAFKVGPGDVVEIGEVSAPPRTIAPFEFKLSVLFEDSHLLVIDKPAGLSMHPGAGNVEQTLANAVVHHVGIQQSVVGSQDRPGIVHRLDKDTTGVVVVAKSTGVHAELARQFAERSIERTYVALVFTTPRAKRPVQVMDSGEVRAAIGRHPTRRTLMAVVDSGKPALTQWNVLERFTYGTLVTCRLHTGRTHQIRVHMNSIGCPLIGDRTYGDFSNLPRVLRDGAENFGRQALHAATLSFTHPITTERVSFSSPLPGDFQDLLCLFRQESGS